MNHVDSCLVDRGKRRIERVVVQTNGVAVKDGGNVQQEAVGAALDPHHIPLSCLFDFGLLCREDAFRAWQLDGLPLWVDGEEFHRLADVVGIGSSGDEHCLRCQRGGCG